jgi:hypothetical protein
MGDINFNEEKRRINYYIYKRDMRITIIGVVLILAGLIIFVLRPYFVKSNIFDIYSTVFSIILITTGSGSLLYRYLQMGFIRQTSSLDSYRDISVRNEIEQLRIELMKLRKKSGTQNETENLTETINKIINNTLSEEFVQSKVDSVYAEKALNQSIIKKLSEDFENLGYRIDI